MSKIKRFLMVLVSFLVVSVAILGGLVITKSRQETRAAQGRPPEPRPPVLTPKEANCEKVTQGIMRNAQDLKQGKKLKTAGSIKISPMGAH